MLRTDMKSRGPADAAIDEMVRLNPASAQALVSRWRYRRDFGLPADKGDVARALRLAPRRRRRPARGGRDSPSKPRTSPSPGSTSIAACEKHPANPDFYRLSAGLELAENHPDRAEVVLRRGIAAVPSNVDFKVLLTDSLITQEKVDGEDGAAPGSRGCEVGLADGYAYHLEARVSMVKQQWHEAISKLRLARSLLAADPALVSRVNLLLAECHSRTGEKEKRVAALQRAASGETTTAMAGPLLAQSMESEGRLDEAIKVHLTSWRARPESRLDLVRLLIQKTSRQPRDLRNWQEVEHALVQAEEALPREIEKLVLLRVDLELAQDRLANALSVLSSAQAKDPQNLQYRLALARLTRRKGDSTAALQILDQAEKDLGPSLDLQLARLEYWGLEAGDAAKAEVAKLVETRGSIPDANRPEFLDRLASVEMLQGEPTLARQHWRNWWHSSPETCAYCSDSSTWPWRRPIMPMRWIL